jgi:hypothetical protein
MDDEWRSRVEAKLDGIDHKMTDLARVEERIAIALQQLADMRTHVTSAEERHRSEISEMDRMHRKELADLDLRMRHFENASSARRGNNTVMERVMWVIVTAVSSFVVYLFSGGKH